MLDQIRDSIIPPRCLVCGSGKDVRLGVCAGCRDKIKLLPQPGCEICGKPLGRPGVCIECLERRPEFDRVVSYACFDGIIRDIIHAFKYRKKTVFKRFLGELVSGLLTEMDIDIDIITPVPLYWTRLFSRGFNQAALIAKEVSWRTGIALDCSVLKKTRKTAIQVSLSGKEREKNLKGAFVASGVKGKAVMVIDDVITTGATANEVARALKSAGASYVLFAGVARTILQ